MKPELWKVFTKNGDMMNLSNDSYLNMIFSTNNGKDAAGYIITDVSGLMNRTYIINGGWNYDNSTNIYVDYTFNPTGVPFIVDSSIIYNDVSIFNPTLQNTKSIYNVTINDTSVYIYPSVTYAGAIFLNPVSKGLVETEHLTFIQDDLSLGYVTPYDSSFYNLVFKMIGEENQIQFFTLDDNTQEITWSNELVYDVSTYLTNQGLQINIGFVSEEEGVFERRMVTYHKVGETLYPLMEFVINAQAIGEDQRFDTIMDNFGLYKPKSIYNLFKESDINEDKPDFNLLNYKAKHMILEHDKIMPYIGTYKGLINAIKWLGYEDIQIKEWFKDVKENRKISLYVPYDADGRKKTIKYFTPEERKNLKKLNQLSMVYCITRETGEIDEWGNPLTENCYEYNLNEILIKLYSLKTWLEKNIIGVNTRIYDITGEGVYFERYKNIIYGTQNKGSVANYIQSLTPVCLSESSELITGESSIGLTLKEFSELSANELNCNALNTAFYGYDPSNGIFGADEYYRLSYIDPSAVFIGSSAAYPFVDMYDIQWKLSVQKQYGVVSNNLVSNPLFIHENEIKYYNIFDTSSLFYDISTNLDITIENGYLRDPSIDNWEDSIAYSIYPEETSMGVYTGKYIFESSMGIKSYTWNEFTMQQQGNNSMNLIYAYDSIYKVPLLTLTNFSWTDSSGITNNINQKYILDIIDGKISMDSSVFYNNSIIDITEYINFNYDTSLSEQQITLNLVQESPRMPLFTYDASVAQNLYYNIDSSLTLTDDNSTYFFKTNHTGDYNIEILGWNTDNNLFNNRKPETYSVWQKYPTINSYIDTSCAGNIIYTCTSSYITPTEVSTMIYNDIKPIFEKNISLYGLTLEFDNELNTYYIKVPSITYFQDIPEPESINNFYNLTEQITNITSNHIVIETNYQWFNVSDNISLVKFDKGQQISILEVSTYITSIDSSGYFIQTIPSGFTIDNSTDWYVINKTERLINRASNLTPTTISCDISLGSSTEYYSINELVSILIQDLSTNYQWGSSFRVSSIGAYDSSFGRNLIFEGNLPYYVLNNIGKYKLTAKHAFSTFVNFQINTDYANEINNNFHIYLDDTYYLRYYLDKTFVYINVLFDQEKVLLQWFDPSTDLGMINKSYYPFNHSVQLDVSSLVILNASYDTSNYMLNQKNIWEIRKSEDKSLVMVVNNLNVPYIFNETGDYDVKCQSYDSYGNLKEQYFEGLIKIV